MNINVGSHFRGRDIETVRRMGKKSDAPAYRRASSILTDAASQHEETQSGHQFARKFGVGVSLYMKMLKFYAYVYGAMAILNIPALVAFVMGKKNVSDGDEVSGAGLEVFTLANVPQSNSTSLSWGSLTQPHVFTLLTYFDCASIALFMAATMFLIKRQKEFDDDIDLIETTAADYTVYVENLPADVDDPAEIKEYFESLLASEMDASDLEQQNNAVAEVVVHRKCATLIFLAEEVAFLSERITHLENSATPSPSHLHPFEAKIKKLKAKLQKLSDKLEEDIQDPGRPSVGAFVTFENDEGKDFVVRFFKKLPKSKYSSTMFRSTHHLKVRRAVEPDDVFFENLEKTPTEIFFGRVSSFLIIFVVLVIALTINFAIKIEVKALRPDTASCLENFEYTREMADKSPNDKDCYCNQSGFSDLSFCSSLVGGIFFSYFASLLTAAVNILLASTIRNTMKLQLWKTRSSGACNAMTSTFVAQFVNSAMVLIIVNLDWKSYAGFSFGVEEVNGFGFDWYILVATPVLITLMANSIVPHVVLFGKKQVARIKIWLGCKKCKTQFELNRLYRKSVFNFTLSESYAFILTTIFITNFFSAVIPVMPFVASFTFFLMYRINKYNLLRYYVNVSEMKAYDSQMARLCATFLPASAVMHTMASAVLLSDSYLSPYSIELSDSSSRFDFIARCTLPNTFPLIILGFVFIFITTCINSKAFFDMVAPDCLKANEELGELEDNPTWTETLEEFGGSDGEVFSYHIGDIPYYRDILVPESESHVISTATQAARRHASSTLLVAVAVAKLRLRTLSRSQSTLTGVSETIAVDTPSPDRNNTDAPTMHGIDEFFHAEEAHRTSAPVLTPTSPSAPVARPEPLSPEAPRDPTPPPLPVEPDSPPRRAQSNSSDQHMMTPVGSLDSTVAAAAAASPVTPSTATTTATTVTTPGHRLSHMQEDHHAIADIFLGSNLLTKHHDEQVTKKLEKREKRELKKQSLKIEEQMKEENEESVRNEEENEKKNKEKEGGGEEESEERTTEISEVDSSHRSPSPFVDISDIEEDYHEEDRK